jgi:hypothetical protein
MVKKLLLSVLFFVSFVSYSFALDFLNFFNSSSNYQNGYRYSSALSNGPNFYFDLNSNDDISVGKAEYRFGYFYNNGYDSSHPNRFFVQNRSFQFNTSGVSSGVFYFYLRVPVYYNIPSLPYESSLSRGAESFGFYSGDGGIPSYTLKPVHVLRDDSYDYFNLRVSEDLDYIPSSHYLNHQIISNYNYSSYLYVNFYFDSPSVENNTYETFPSLDFLVVFYPDNTHVSGEVSGGGSYPPGVPEGCTCGACCSDKCTCENWLGKWCTPFPLVEGGSIGEGSRYICFHSCPGAGCSHIVAPLEYTHCECHHPQHEHFESFITTPDFESYGLFVPELPDISSPFEPPIIPPDLPIFQLPNISLPGFNELSLPDIPGDSEFEFFNYSESNVFPEFKFEAMFNGFKDDFSEKIDLSVYERLGEDAQAEHLVWRINHTIMGFSFGPYDVDFSEIISQAKDFTGVSIIRAILLFILYTIFIYFILRMLFF